MGFLGGALDNPLDNAGDWRFELITGLGGSPGGEHGNHGLWSLTGCGP